MPASGRLFVMAGGGTGGHVIPNLAVAEELRRRGHELLFIGTSRGMEARLVPAAGFPLELIDIGGLQRVGWRQTIRTLWQLPLSVWRVLRVLRRRRPAAVFSMGGYAAGPVVFAARLLRLPVIVMEPNAMPGLTNRLFGRFVQRALLSFPEAAAYFPPGRAEVTGLPVRREFFTLPERPPSAPFTILITGGSRGSRTLNRAGRESWPLLRERSFPVRLLHQTGTDEHTALAEAFAKSGVQGEVVAFIREMPEAFAQADLIVCRSGAGAVAELAAAGKPAILVPFPFASDQHQLRNAEALQRAGAARLVLDGEMSGPRLVEEVSQLLSAPETLRRMAQAARTFAHPAAAERAADVVEAFALQSRIG